ncbi:MAG: PAS domain-containing protein, partial [Desulfobacterales bacterium]|nr:PAS domain-containing protein [Desulfobacterales bacterium]
ICSSNYVIEYMNPSMEKRLGGGATGRNCHKVIYNQNEICPWCVFEKIKINETVDYELKNPCNQNDYLITNVPILDTNGHISKLTVAKDITLRKRYEEKLIKEKIKLEKALVEIKTLSGLLPICAQCKKIRDDKGYWNTLESYIERHSEASFSHGLCKECSDDLYGDENWYIKMKKRKATEADE